MNYYRVEGEWRGEWKPLAVVQMNTETEVLEAARTALPDWKDCPLQVIEITEAEFEAGRKRMYEQPKLRCPVCFGPAEIGVAEGKQYLICRTCNRHWEAGGQGTIEPSRN